MLIHRYTQYTVGWNERTYMRIHRYTQYTVGWNERTYTRIHWYTQYTVGWNERYKHAHAQVHAVHGGLER